VNTLWIDLIYGYSYIIDEWGGISLPFRTQYCQHIFPTTDFAIYQCDTTSSDQHIIRKITYEESLCEYSATDTDDIAPRNFTINSNSNDTEIASIKYDCTDDLSTTDSDNTNTQNDNENVIELHAICDYSPPGERDLYLAIDLCFLLSNKTVQDVTIEGNTTTIQYRQQVLYAKFDCSFGDDTEFITRLYENDDKCANDPTIERTMKELSCEPWLYENETNFGFDVQALMWACDQSGGNMSFIFNSILIILCVILTSK